jgi:hypothetical protein
MAQIPWVGSLKWNIISPLHGITDELAKLCYGVLYLDPEMLEMVEMV